MVDFENCQEITLNYTQDCHKVNNNNILDTWYIEGLLFE